MNIICCILLSWAYVCASGGSI